ncbi:MAG TPA: hypothetical protein VKF15_05945 [Nitrososphaerales archaeon]|nr:hypothetical protein [Nitrososphaerales archaeon]
MKTRGRLTVKCRDAAVARQLEDVLAPDNTGVPKDQRFTMRRTGDSLVFLMETGTLPPLVATALSILSDASLFQEVWLLSRGGDAAVGRRH